MSYALFATPLSSQQQLAPRSPLPPTISLRGAARPDRDDADAAAEEGSPHGKKPSNSEVLRRAPDAPETLLPHSARSKGGEPSLPRAAGGEGARPLPNSMPFRHYGRPALLARSPDKRLWSARNVSRETSLRENGTPEPGERWTAPTREVFHVKHPERGRCADAGEAAGRAACARGGRRLMAEGAWAQASDQPVGGAARRGTRRARAGCGAGRDGRGRGGRTGGRRPDGRHPGARMFHVKHSQLPAPSAVNARGARPRPHLRLRARRRGCSTRA